MGLTRLEAALLSIPAREAVAEMPPVFHLPAAMMTPREAMLGVCETLPVEVCEGRILAAATVGCPPAVPIAVSGERIDKETLERFAYYGIATSTVVL